MEEFYQDALQAIYETSPAGCKCEMSSCIDWTQVQAEGDTELSADDQAELDYLTALNDKLDALNTQVEAGNYDSLDDSSNSLLLLILLKKKNHNPLKTIFVLKKLSSSDASGVVKLLVFKKMFGNSHTLLLLDLLGVVGDSETEQSLQEANTRSRLVDLILFKKIFGSSTLKKLFIFKAIGNGAVATQTSTVAITSAALALFARLF